MPNTDKNTLMPQCDKNAVIASAFSNTELENLINYWVDHYTKNGDSHYSDTKDWKIREIYWDKIVDRVIEDVNIEMTDSEIEKFCDRLADL
jgi:stalled ribosome rescue protein Dom34